MILSFPFTYFLTLGSKATAPQFKAEVLVSNLAFVDKFYNTHPEARVSNSRVVVSVQTLRFPPRGIFTVKQAQLRILQLSDSLNVPWTLGKKRYMGKNAGLQIMKIFKRATLIWTRCKVIQLWTYLHNPPSLKQVTVGLSRNGCWQCC